MIPNDAMTFELLINRYFHAANRCPAARRLVPMLVSHPEMINKGSTTANTHTTSVNADGCPALHLPLTILISLVHS